MRLTEQIRRLRSRHVYLIEACSHCGGALGPIRWTIRDKAGAWCSQKCRDGEEHKKGFCRGCGVSLNGMRKHAKFCSDTCRKRLRVRERSRKPEMPIADKAFTGAIWGFGYGDTRHELGPDQELSNPHEGHT
jgi:hypothetical protein